MNGTRGLTFLLLIAGAVYGFGLGGASLWDIDEAIYADISRNMAESGDWVMPIFNHAPRYDKPPLMYWLTAAVMSVFGPSEWAGRVGSYVFSLFGIGLVYAFGRRYFSERAALLGALALSSTLGWFIIGRIGLMDAALTGFVGLALYILSVLVERERGANGAAARGYAARPGGRAAGGYAGRGAWAAAYAALGLVLGLGVLTKGPVAIVLVGGAALLYVGPRFFLRGRVLAGACIALAACLAVALPWHLAIYARAGREWWDSYFGYHMFSRFTQPIEEHGFAWYYYIIVLAVGFLPWTGYALAGAWAFLRRGPLRLLRHDGVRLLVAWFTFVFLFFSISRTKLPGYILPAFLPLAVLVGAWCDRRLEEPRPERAFHAGLWASLAAGVLTAAGLAALGPMVPPGFESLHRLLFAFPAGLVAGMLLTKAAHLVRRTPQTLLYGFAATMFAGMLLFSGGLIPLIEEHKPVKPLVEAAMPHLTPDTQLVSAMGDASTSYYSRRPVVYVYSAEEARRLVEGDRPVVALVPQTMLESLTEVEILARHGEGVLIRTPGGGSAGDSAGVLPGAPLSDVPSSDS